MYAKSCQTMTGMASAFAGVTSQWLVAQSALRALLDDYLYGIRARLGEAAFPRSAADYLDDWCGDGQDWLRKFYPDGGDEPHFDLTPATEKAIEWLATLRDSEDLISVGAYVKGTTPRIDAALERRDAIARFLCQPADTRVEFPAALAALQAL